ncbi:MAG: hypothetical protein RR052_05780 [Oscillospiraceae bacterium]
MASVIIPCVIIAILLFFVAMKQKNKNEITDYFIVAYITRKKKRGVREMAKLIESCIGRECIISTFQGNVQGTVQSVEGNWVLVANGSDSEVINLDFICRIKALPIKTPIINIDDIIAD